VAFILIFAATIGKISAYVTSETVIGGIVACGVFLLLVSILGLIGAVKHHQVLLFFYMVILFLLFIVQFSVAIACLAVTDKQQVELLRNVSEIKFK
jgi:tetraspanin-13/31